MPNDETMVRTDLLGESNFGTARTPLETPNSAWKVDHPAVGDPAQVTPYAVGPLRKVRGKHGTIKRVAEMYGKVVGLEVEIDGQTQRAPLLNFWYQRPISVDFEPCSDLTVVTKGALEPWRNDGARTYYGPSWDGVEDLYREMARIWAIAGIESAGWWSWPSSPDQRGKAWRLLHPSEGGNVAVYCHSEMLPHAWTLQVTVRDVPQPDMSKVDYLHHGDYWQRVFHWVLKTIAALGGPQRFPEAARVYAQRVKASASWSGKARASWPYVVNSVGAVCGAEAQERAAQVRWSLGFSRLPTRVGSIGSHERPTQVLPCSVIAINPQAFDRGEDYVRWIMLHELVHAALGPMDLADSHGPVFQRVSTMMDIPVEYQD